MKQWIVPLSLALLLTACGGNKTPQNPDSNPVQTEEAKADNNAKADAKNTSDIEKFVSANAENLANYAMKFAKSDDLSNEIQKLVTAAPPSKKAKADPNLIKFVQQADLKEIYEARQFSPIFVTGSSLVSTLDPLVKELEQLENHGLFNKLDATAWLNARQTLVDVSADNRDENFTFTAEEQAKLVSLIAEKGVNYTDASSVKAFMSELVKDETMMPRLHQAVTERAQKMAKTAQQAAELEVRTADLAMRFARSMAFENLTHLTDEETASLGKRPTDAKYAAITARRTRLWFDSLVRVLDVPTAAKAEQKSENVENAGDSEDVKVADDVNVEPVIDEAKDAHAAETAAANAQKDRLQNAQDVASLVQALYPPHPAYKKLMEARSRYASLADWEKINAMTLKKGKANKEIPALKRRLAAEGYFHGDISENASDIYDDEIRAAVKLYHDAHQLALDEDKGIQKSFWESLNTPRTKRLEQIEENLRRWHKTQIIESPYYIFINVPDFHGEVWRNGEMVYRFPVVAGNAKRACDPETKQWKFINATPLMHARMLYIEYNPYWIVPPRIEQEDYIEKINADPNWLTEHGFEYYTDKGHTTLRQLPGEKNALGRVKFIFPNPHSTFLHDSPQKGLFRYPIRAFSHGCMRVWEPLELAKRLLQYDGQWYNKLAEEIEDLQPRRFILKTRFDVFIDYFNVRVDDDGVVYFLADPYRYIRYALEPPSAKELKCKPQPKAWIARTSLQGDVGADSESE